MRPHAPTSNPTVPVNVPFGARPPSDCPTDNARGTTGGLVTLLGLVGLPRARDYWGGAFQL